MNRTLRPLRFAVLTALLLALCGAYGNRELLASATPGDLTILLVCLFLPFIPLVVTPLLLPSKDNSQVDL